MNLFYTNDIQDNIGSFKEEEARHCIQVLRKQIGDPIQFVDGQGNWYKGVISSSSKKTFQVTIESQSLLSNHRANHLHIAIAPTKNISRLEWFLEKATEIGIDEITLILSFHSERKRVRLDRLEKVVLAAMKQSLKAHLPIVNDLTKYKDFVKMEFSGDKFIAYVDEKNQQLKDTMHQGNNVLILIGPEGGFSKEEVELATENNFEKVSLGTSRFRTETAGVVACHTNQILNEILK